LQVSGWHEELARHASNPITISSISLFVSLVYCVEGTVRWFVVREKHCWMAADSADPAKRRGCMTFQCHFFRVCTTGFSQPIILVPNTNQNQPKIVLNIIGNN
jgi:hypothetical protein